MEDLAVEEYADWVIAGEGRGDVYLIIVLRWFNVPGQLLTNILKKITS